MPSMPRRFAGRSRPAVAAALAAAAVTAGAAVGADHLEAPILSSDSVVISELRSPSGKARGIVHLRATGSSAAGLFTGLAPGKRYQLAMADRPCRALTANDGFFFDLGAELAATARGTLGFRQQGLELTGPDRDPAKALVLRRASDGAPAVCGRMESLRPEGAAR